MDPSAASLGQKVLPWYLGVCVPPWPLVCPCPLGCRMVAVPARMEREQWEKPGYQAGEQAAESPSLGGGTTQAKAPSYCSMLSSPTGLHLWNTNSEIKLSRTLAGQPQSIKLCPDCLNVGLYETTQVAGPGSWPSLKVQVSSTFIPL